MLLLNVIKIDPFSFELYHFKVCAFFETQCMCVSSPVSLLSFVIN